MKLSFLGAFKREAFTPKTKLTLYMRPLPTAADLQYLTTQSLQKGLALWKIEAVPRINVGSAWRLLWGRMQACSAFPHSLLQATT